AFLLLTHFSSLFLLSLPLHLSFHPPPTPLCFIRSTAFLVKGVPVSLSSSDQSSPPPPPLSLSLSLSHKSSTCTNARAHTRQPRAHGDAHSDRTDRRTEQPPLPVPETQPEPARRHSPWKKQTSMDALKKGFSMAKEGVVAAAEKTKAGVEEAAAKTKEGVMYVGTKTKDGMVAGVNTVAQRTTEQANIVSEATVTGANELSQQTVEGMENVAVSTGLVNQGDFSQGAEQAGQ
uniref:Gamma-synuclein n=2 Tax=Esox lucius TaxID=8010 RepID=A0A3P8YR56_ESOLU